MDDLSRSRHFNGLSQARRDRDEHAVPQAWCDDDDDADIVVSQRLLELHSTIGRYEHIERSLRTTQQVTVFETCPTLLLYRADRAAGKVAAQPSRHVLVEQNTPHAIFASNARPASSRNATACSCVTVG